VFMGSRHGSRSLFPHARSMVYIRSPRRGVEVRRLDDLNGRQLGDSTITAGIPLTADQRIAVAVKAPTGKANMLSGSGAWDLGAGWNGTFIRGSREFLIAAAYTRLGGPGTLLGIKRCSYLLDASAEVQQNITPQTTIRASAHLDTSPLRGRTNTNIGHAALLFYVGAVHSVTRAAWIAFDVGEGYPAIGVANDWSFHLGVGTSFSKGAAR
jgi:hypothetical protein